MHSFSCNYRQLVVDHVQAMVAKVKSLGARPMMWHDMLLEKGDPRWPRPLRAYGSRETAMMANDLPKDVVICDWYYNEPLPKVGFPTVEHFLKMGFPVITCPRDDVEGIAWQTSAAREKHLFGVLGTTWARGSSRTLTDIFTRTAMGAWSDKSAANPKAGDADAALWLEFGTHWRQAGWDTGLGPGDYAETGFNSNQTSTDVTAEREWNR